MNLSTTPTNIDYQATYGPLHERRRYIKLRIIDAERSSDHYAVEVWTERLKQLENK